MNYVFNLCVYIMQVISPMLGLTYQEFNVILFVIVHPLITLIILYKCMQYRRLWKNSLSDS